MRKPLCAVVFGSLLTTALVLGGCSSSPHNEAAAIKLDQSSFAVKPWKSDASQMTTVHGQLLAGEKPVSHALVQVADKRTVETDQQGAFEIQVDQSKLAKITVKVASAKSAAVGGKPVDARLERTLLGAANEIDVVYPIQISKAAPSAQNPNQMEIHGQAIMQGGASFPTLLVDKYGIYGVVKDAAGNPVENATVTIRRGGVEGFAKSQPSGKDGQYKLEYVPEDDEEIYLSVFVGEKQYRLPDDKVLYFPEDTSVQVDMTLPKEGNVIEDVRPYLVVKTAPGALYKGTVIGINVDDSAAFSVTIPKADGSFLVNVPKDVWDRHPSFYETEMSTFTKAAVSPGDAVPSSFLDKPKPTEPDRIIAN